VRTRVAVALVMALVMAGGACGARGGPAAAAGKVKVVAGFYPLAEAAARVGGDRVAVTNLTPAGAEPHDLEPTSKDLDRIEAAAVVLYLGHGFQSGVEKAAKRAKATAVDLLDPAFGLVEGVPDESGHLGTDPHVWLDPTLMARIVGKVQAALIAADPAGQSAYEANGAAYQAALAALDAAYRQGLATCDRKVIVTAHAAFGYLARRYGLVQDAVTGLSPESEPDPKRLAGLAAKVRAQGVTTVFYETLVSPKVARTLARETGATAAALDPIEGLTRQEQAAGKNYLSLMGDNLAALRAALSCR
jgi:zinc transport system substrate-binding protein